MSFERAMKTSCLASLLLAAACGDGLADADYQGGPLATIHGQVINSQGLDAGGSVRAALVWANTLADVPLLAAQETAVTTEFPSSFELAIDALPPESVMMADPELLADRRWALASVVIYADENGNGRLDLPTAADVAIPETILGVRDDMWVIYLEGGSAPLFDPTDDPSSPLIPAGFSLLDSLSDDELTAAFETCAAQYPSYDAEYEACLDAAIGYPEVLAIDAPLDIELSTTPKLPGMVCLGILDSFMESLAPEYTMYTTEVTCDADNRCYTETYTLVNALSAGSPVALCLGADALSPQPVYVSLQPTDPVPAGWPCPGA